MGVLERVAADRRAGRLWKARDRLMGAVATDRTNSQVMDALG
jgi:hypothetical protein